MRRHAILTLAAAGLATLGTAAAPAGASCVASVTYLGAPFVAVGQIDAAEVAGRVGPGAIPACNDTIPSLGAGEPTPVTVHRVRGVAPRLGVAVRSSSDRASLMVLLAGPCPIGSAERALACLRRETWRLVQGPSLVAPVSAEAGAAIRIAVNVREPRLRRSGVTGLETRFQARVNGRWRSIFYLQHPLPDFGGRLPDPVPVGTPGYAVRLIGLALNHPHPVRLPEVAPGQYRLAKGWVADGRRHTAVATITIR